MKSLKFSLRGGKVERYHTIAGVSQSVAEHTFNAAHILYYITDGQCSKESLVFILHHDVAECETGDIPHCAKRDSTNLKILMDELEERAMSKKGLQHTMYGVNDGERRLIKLADLCEMGLYALHLDYLGNGQATYILYNVVQALEKLKPFANTKVSELFSIFLDEYNRALIKQPF